MSAKIKLIRATGLLGALHLEWHLTSGVNIISGGNGSGKSTLLRGVAQMLLEGRLSENGGGALVSVDVLSDGKAITADDVIVVSRSLLSLDCRGAAADAMSDERFATFCDIVDDLFEASHKKIDRTSSINDLKFTLTTRDGQSVTIGYDWLSSGEKLAVALFSAVAERPKASILILDEPEVSLSIEWQKTLIEDLLQLNDQLQIVVATHSPAIVMRGWVDCVTEIDDLIVNS